MIRNIFNPSEIQPHCDKNRGCTLLFGLTYIPGGYDRQKISRFFFLQFSFCNLSRKNNSWRNMKGVQCTRSRRLTPWQFRSPYNPRSWSQRTPLGTRSGTFATALGTLVQPETFCWNGLKSGNSLIVSLTNQRHVKLFLRRAVSG